MPAPKLYEILMKSIVNKTDRVIHCWQNSENGKLLIEWDEIQAYAETVLDNLEAITGELWTDDTSFFHLTDAIDEECEALTGELETYE
jgi:hypothetical protein